MGSGGRRYNANMVIAKQHPIVRIAAFVLSIANVPVILMLGYVAAYYGWLTATPTGPAARGPAQRYLLMTAWAVLMELFLLAVLFLPPRVIETATGAFPIIIEDKD